MCVHKPVPGVFGHQRETGEHQAVTGYQLRRTFSLVFAMIFFISAGVANAVQPDEILADPVLETRARAITTTLRCLVCQNQSIDDSDSEFARDLRVLVRERLSLGESDDAVYDYLVSRFGEFVLLQPRFSLQNLALWLLPLLLLMAGALAVWKFFRRSRRDQHSG